MNSNIQLLQNSFSSSTMLLKKSITDVKPEDLIIRFDDKVNSYQFLIGHITAHRFYICSLAGNEQEYKHGEIFGYGVDPKASDEYPSVEQLMNDFKTITPIMEKTLDNASDKHLALECPIKFPTRDKTNLGGIAFMAYHESYHVGQLAYLRRLLGYDQLIG